MTEKGKILKSASVITLATVISRILGYFRDQRITLLLGTSVAADSFVLAYRIPNLLRRLVGEGSLTAAFIPVFTSYLARGDREAVWQFANRVFWALALVLACLTALGMIFSAQIVHLFTLFGSNASDWSLAVYLNRLIFPFLFFIGLSALAMAILNSLHIFGLPASTPIVFNVAIILCSVAAIYRPALRLLPEVYRTPAVILALGVVIGGALQFLMQVPALIRHGMRFVPSLSFSDPGVRKVGRLMAPGFFGIGIYQVNFFVNMFFAASSKMPRGTLTSLYVAERVVELVLGAYAISVATTILPMMSHQAAVGDLDKLKSTFTFSLRIVSFLAIPAAIGLIVLREPIIQVLFQHGQFSAESTQLTSRALLFGAIGLPAFAGIKLIVPAFYSTHDTQTPVRVAAWTLILNLTFNLLFLELFFATLRNGSPPLATSLAAYFNFFLLFWILRERLGRLGTRDLMLSLTKILACSAAMAGICYISLHWSGFNGYNALFARGAALLGMIVAGILVYLGLARLLKCEEIDEVLAILRKAEREPVAPAVLPD